MVLTRKSLSHCTDIEILSINKILTSVGSYHSTTQCTKITVCEVTFGTLPNVSWYCLVHVIFFFKARGHQLHCRGKKTNVMLRRKINNR